MDKTVETVMKDELITILPKFYATVKTDKRQSYSAVSLLCIRSSLNRSIAAFHMPCFNIITDPEFQSANRVLKAMLKKARAEGKGQIKHKAPVTEEDFRKMYQHPTALNTNTPTGLSNRVYVEVNLFFCRRGVESLSQLMVEDFEVPVDSSGQKFVKKVKSESDKNHQGSSVELHETEGGRMYATEERDCPVITFEKYISKLNKKCPRFFQKPRSSYAYDDDCWFENKPLGANTIGTKMARISQEAELSQKYTSHCLRATSITTLSRAGFEARHIRIISGRKGDQALDNYVRETSEQQRRSMSSANARIASPSSISSDSVHMSSGRSGSSDGPGMQNSVSMSASFDITPNDFFPLRSVGQAGGVPSAPAIWNINATNVHIHNHYN